MSEQHDSVGESETARPTGRALLATPGKGVRERLLCALDGFDCVWVESVDDAMQAIQDRVFDVAFVQTKQAGGCGFEVARLLLEGDPALAVIMLSARPTLDEAVRAMKLGCVDLAASSVSGEDLGELIAGASAHAAARRDEQRRVRGLEDLCRSLNSARQEVTRHVGSLCDDLVNAYQELSDQLDTVTLAGEFDAVIRQELDIEELLRTVLEFVLAKVGPLNAGIFLPSTSGDYTLGAYINYDCAKDSAEVMLDHLADTLPHAFEGEHGVFVLEDDAEIEERLGSEWHWLGGRSVLVFSCIDDDETLGVVSLFRRDPFTPDQVAVFRTIAELFARQLARVVRTHHRHLPRDQWGALGDPEDGWDDLDAAA